MRVVVAVIAAVCAVLGVAGCGGVEGEAQAGGPFDGCEVFPDDALVAAGVDPASEEFGTDGKIWPGWTDCLWRSDSFFLASVGTGMSLGEIRSNPKNTDFRDVVVAGRNALEHRLIADTGWDACILAFESSGGVIMVRFDNMVSAPNPVEPCTALSQRIVPLIPYLPA